MNSALTIGTTVSVWVQIIFTIVLVVATVAIGVFFWFIRKDLKDIKNQREVFNKLGQELNNTKTINDGALFSIKSAINRTMGYEAMIENNTTDIKKGVADFQGIATDLKEMLKTGIEDQTELNKEMVQIMNGFMANLKHQWEEQVDTLNTTLEVKIRELNRTLEIIGEQFNKTLELTGKRIDRTIEDSGRQNDRMITAIGKQSERALESIGKQLDATLATTSKSTIDELIAAKSSISRNFAEIDIRLAKIIIRAQDQLSIKIFNRSVDVFGGISSDMFRYIKRDMNNLLREIVSVNRRIPLECLKIVEKATAAQLEATSEMVQIEEKKIGEESTIIKPEESVIKDAEAEMIIILEQNVDSSFQEDESHGALSSDEIDALEREAYEFSKGEEK